MKQPAAYRYLLFFEGFGTVVEMLPGDSSDYYGLVQREFAKACGGTKDASGRFEDPVEMVKLWVDQKIGAVHFEEELAGPSGSSFRVIQMPETSDAEITAATDKLRRDRDVVRLSVLRVKSSPHFQMPARPEAAHCSFRG